MQTNTLWLKFGGLSLALTLKIISRSPKPIQLFIMSKCYIHANLVKIQLFMRYWANKQLFMRYWAHSTFWLKFGNLSPAVTLKNRSRSPKPNQLFIMSQCYIHANLVIIQPLIHEISCKEESVALMPTLTPTPMGSAPKTICPPPLQWET